MKKLRIDDLQVESFATARRDELRGTVFAKETEYPCWTAAPETRCYDSCEPPYSCGALCEPQDPDTGTCVSGQCEFSSVYTCALGC